MKSMHNNLTVALIGGVIGLILTGFFAPKIISLLFTAPVSFGIQCEPVGHWAMEKLLLSQIIGFLVGMILVFIIKTKFFKEKNKSA